MNRWRAELYIGLIWDGERRARAYMRVGRPGGLGAENYLALGRLKQTQNLPLLCILQTAYKPQQDG